MNVLFTMTGSWGTGSGTVVEAVVDELVARGHRVCVLYPRTAAAPETGFEHAPEARHEVWPFPLLKRGVELYTYPLMIPDPNPSNFDGAWTFRDLTQDQIDLYIESFSERLMEVVRGFEPDVIECQHIWLMPYAVAELGLPFFVTAHHSDQMGFEFDKRIRPYATRAAEAAETVFAITEANREEIVRHYGIPEEKVVCLGNGYDKEVFTPVEVDRKALLERFGLEIPPGCPLVTFAGKLSKTKGVDTLLLANRLLQEAREEAGEPPVHLVLFGTGKLEAVLDPEDEPLYSMAHVHLLGHQPYEVVRDFHNVARFSVMPSRTEGFGLAALEAMGCGLPMVVTEIGAADTYAVGEAVPPESPALLAEAMLKLLRMPDDAYRQLRERALAKAQEFSWATITEKRLEHYAEAPPVMERVRARSQQA
ncbi:MAG: glycosyltransferase family 4 protein [Rhodothermales bacterium]|nr:glycosyltransferase family 4 protein [Rhodothermales bacterium]